MDVGASQKLMTAENLGFLTSYYKNTIQLHSKDRQLINIVKLIPTSKIQYLKSLLIIRPIYTILVVAYDCHPGV